MKCNSCGGKLNQEGSVFVCQECGATFKKEDLSNQIESIKIAKANEGKVTLSLPADPGGALCLGVAVRQLKVTAGNERYLLAKGDTLTIRCDNPINIVVKGGGAFNKVNIDAKPGDKYLVNGRGFGVMYYEKLSGSNEMQAQSVQQNYVDIPYSSVGEVHSTHSSENENTAKSGNHFVAAEYILCVIGLVIAEFTDAFGLGEILCIAAVVCGIASRKKEGYIGAGITAVLLAGIWIGF